ncbi:hypothetical protein WN55_06869 [Dufourea novaeangliae]|uniref:Transposable element Tc3 transposase n=1 Tax=Dufourea novaeangliae TaxID=178035 RepID=A0A154PR55_DUFNO|nr:hypothetical protein WN55_06869 [Dufourea novaeangliae]
MHYWCGIVGDQIIGPHFIDGNLTGEPYAHFIRSRLGTLLENVSLNVRQMIWLWHDGCPAHCARRVRDALNELYPNKWIRRGGLVSWLPRSPDLTRLDLRLWRALKNAVYQEVPTTPENMKQRIIAVCIRISSDTIRHARDAAVRRLQVCIDANGHHFQYLL